MKFKKKKSLELKCSKVAFQIFQNWYLVLRPFSKLVSNGGKKHGKPINCNDNLFLVKTGYQISLNLFTWN